MPGSVGALVALAVSTLILLINQVSDLFLLWCSYICACFADVYTC